MSAESTQCTHYNSSFCTAAAYRCLVCYSSTAAADQTAVHSEFVIQKWCAWHGKVGQPHATVMSHFVCLYAFYLSCNIKQFAVQVTINVSFL
jgi:hypothetical protein